MKRTTSYLLATALAVGPAIAGNLEAPDVNRYEQQLNNATQITVDERVMNIGKDYDILVDSDKVATVSGKDVKLWADTFTLKTDDGKVLAYEEERKRVFRFSRGAEIFDAQGNTTGYLAEQHFKDFFRLSYVFHFFDAQGNEVGESAKLTNSHLGKHDIKDSQGNIDYRIDKKFAIAGDKYVIDVVDQESEVPLEHVILLTCIEDAIADSQDE